MALPALIERALTSSGVNLTCGPVMVNAAWRGLVMSVLCTDVHLFLWNTMYKGVWLVVSWYQTYATCILVAATAHALGSPVVPWPICFPLIQFLLLVKSRLIKVYIAHSCGVAVVAGV